MKKLIFILLLFIPQIVWSAPPSRVYTYNTGDTLDAAKNTANEDALFNYLTTGVDTYTAGSIKNADVSGSAAITYGKLSLGSSILSTDIKDGEIVNADISSSAAIADSKLAQITTASKVSGAALTSLSSIPSGAGAIPAANVTAATSLPDSSLAAITTASKVNTSALYGTTYLPDSTVDTTALKTATGEVSGAGNHTLPGGEYGFYPQYKCAPFSTGVTYISASLVSASYVTNVFFDEAAGYVQQRYVTASGEDLWVFLLIDKTTKEIISAYQAPDAPHYGNGGDYSKVPHPFGSYNPALQEIILVNKETAVALKTQATVERSILTIINEDMKIDYTKEEVYEPLHSGKFLTKDGKQVKEMITEIAPYIKVRPLLKLSDTEKANKKAKQEQARIKAEQDKVKREQDKISAVNKLKALGLTEDEIKCLK